MLRRDLIFYRTLLPHIPLGELVRLYERNATEYPVLAQAVADEMNTRFARQAPEPWGRNVENKIEVIDSVRVSCL